MRYNKSKAIVLMDESFSLKQSIIVALYFYTAEISCFKTFYNMNKETYLELASLLAKNFPNILIPNVLRVFADSIVIIVLTASYNTAFPVFLLEVVLVVTYANISDTSSDSYKLLAHIILKNLSISIYRKGSDTPEISYSAE